MILKRMELMTALTLLKEISLNNTISIGTKLDFLERFQKEGDITALSFILMSCIFTEDMILERGP